MENEKNYIIESIEAVQSDIDYNTKGLALCEDIDDRLWFSGLTEQLETENEYLKNILEFIIKHE